MTGAVGAARPSPGTDAGEHTPAGRRMRWSALAGTVVFAYVVFLAVEITAAGFDHRLYNRLHQLQGNAVVRILLGAVVLAALFHGLNGLRVTMCALVPRWSAHERGLRFTVQFLTFAVGIPAAFVVAWPSVSELFA